MSNPNLPIRYGKQSIDELDIKAVESVLKSDYLTQGPVLTEFENEFASYVNSSYAVACNNGTSALHLSMLALGLKKGDLALTTPLTFASTANSVLHCGAEVDFIDINPETLLMDLDKLESYLSRSDKKISGIIPVAFAGLPNDLEKLRKIADKYGCWILEDGCHAPGASFQDSSGQEVMVGDGIYADCTIFSFHPVKHIAAGEGGMITTRSEELAKKMKLFRSHGITTDSNIMKSKNAPPWFQEMQVLGYNYRMADLNAALGLSQLKRASEGLKRRQDIAEIYQTEFSSLPLKMQFIQEGMKHAYHLFVIQADNRRAIFDRFKEAQIIPQIHYVPVYWHPYYQELGFKRGHCPNVEAYYEKCLSLPMYPSLTDQQVGYIVEQTKNIFAN